MAGPFWPTRLWRHVLSRPSAPRFDFDGTFKTLFQQKEMVEDLTHPRFASELQGCRPVRPLTIERASIEAEPEPRTRRRQSDLVWELEHKGTRRLLLLEHQARVDPGMSVRMMEYLLNVWHSTGRRRDLPIYPLVFSTAARPFGVWLQSWPHGAGDRSVFFVEGPLLDIHRYPFPSADLQVFDLPRNNRVTCVIALARLQWALRDRSRAPITHSAVYALIMHVVVDWLKPLLDPDGSELGDAFAVWIATGMADLLRSWPASQEALDNISTLTFAQLERTMITVQELIEEGRQEGQLATLTDYVALYWGDVAATAFRAQLADTTPDQLPTLAELQGRWQRQEPPLPQENGAIHRNSDNPPGHR